jgi:hypothetical protein
MLRTDELMAISAGLLAVALAVLSCLLIALGRFSMAA